MQDGTTKIFLNAYGTMDDIDDDLKAFLDYVAGKQVSHPVVNELDAVVQKVKHNKEWRSEYMRYEHELAAREHLAREDGRKEGRDSVVVASLKSLIKNTRVTVEEAMNMLDIPVADRSKYLALLKG
ncbi:MAG: hypothetical protein IJT01_04860 [Selenomonadaceae bacterium]|nr:hypothetical protein [Selenomonadaceae bacterium]